MAKKCESPRPFSSASFLGLSIFSKSSMPRNHAFDCCAALHVKLTVAPWAEVAYSAQATMLPISDSVRLLHLYAEQLFYNFLFYSGITSENMASYSLLYKKNNCVHSLALEP